MTGQKMTGWLGAGALALGLLAAGLGLPLPASANPFSAVATVNDRVVTQYELDQRILFLQILRQPGDIEALARTGLVEDRLRMIAGEQLGIKLTPEQITTGMNEFAGRANLTAEQFLEAVGQAGVQPETFRDFVEAGMIWREVVRARFGPEVSITDAEVDRALASFKPTTTIKVLLSELVLPASGAERSAALTMARRLKGQIATEEDFAAAARGNSAGETASSGGRLGWQRLSSLPVEAIPVVRALAIGKVSDPVVLGDKVVLYWLRELGEDQLGASTGVTVDYAEFLVPNDQNAGAELARVSASVDTCNDLYGIAKGLPAERLIRENRPQGEVPGDVAAVLTTLDPGEASTALTRGGWRVFLMLCSRGAGADLLPDRETARTQLLNQRLSALAEIYLEELRSEAIIVEQ